MFAGPGLEFEQPLVELDLGGASIASKRSRRRRPSSTTELRAKKRDLADTIRDVYGSLDAWDTVRVARLQDRPKFTDYVELVFDEFVELHGDKFFGDDRALREPALRSSTAAR